MPNEQEMRKHRCCFTGHRPEKLSQNDDEVRQWLTERIASAVSDGFVTFITGMAMGVDIWAGEIVLRLREEDSSLHLIAAVPWPGFSARWNAEWKERYDRLLQNADLVRYISRRYDASVFSMRNTWMVDHSARVIAFYNGAEGSTKELLDYANAQGVETIVGGETACEKAAAVQAEPAASGRPYPLNLLDAILNCDAYRNARPILPEDIPADFERRIRAAASTIRDERAFDYIAARYRDRQTLQSIADRDGLSRERIRQLLGKYLRRLRNPDILRFLDCGIENIPAKTSSAMTEKLKGWMENDAGAEGRQTVFQDHDAPAVLGKAAGGCGRDAASGTR